MSAKYLKLADTLKQLMYDKRLSVADLSREADVPNATLHRIVSGETTRPYLKSLKSLAEYFNITIEQLTGEEPMTEALTNPPFAKGHTPLIEIPLLKWADLDKPFNPLTAEHTIVVTNNISARSFVTAMNDSSMDPSFPKGTLLIIDPKLADYDRAHVLVKIAENNIYIFRQLLIDGEHRFLRPLNPNSDIYQMRLMNPNDRIVGVLTEARHLYNKM